MADKKISALTGATTPLAGTEVLPIVQGSATVKVSVADLTAGRAVAMAGGSFTDNITQSTAAKGVNFTANIPAAGMTSRLLNAYEEGTWTPIDSSGAGLTLTATYGTYTRIGRQVTCIARFTYPVTASVASATIGGLPFTAGSSGGNIIQAFFSARTSTFTTSGGYGAAGGTTFNIDKNNATAAATNLDMSTTLSYMMISYIV